MKIENREDFIKFKNSFKKTINKVTETINDITIFYEKECVTLPLNCKKWVYENYKNTENDLIFGKNNTDKIVNISYKNGKLHIFRELENEILETSTNFKWWLIADVIPNGNFEVLKGNQPLKYLKFFDNRTTFQQANNRLFQLEAKKVRTSDEIEQSLLMDGYTYFKNLKLNDVSILSFDIETTTINPENNEALVLLISNTFRKKDKIVKKLFSLDDFKNELDMILSWCEWVRDVDPSFIVGHNIYSFDLNYLNKRLQICNNTQISEKLNGSNLPLGRDGSPIRISTRPSLFRYDGSQKYEFFNIIIFGREIIDTWFLSMKYDVSRDFPNYKLKDIIKYLNLEKENRIKWDFEKNRPLDIFKNLNRIESKKIWEDFKEYCIDDSDDALKLFDIMAPSFFYTNQAIPKTFQKLLVTATGSWINSFLIRSYLKDGFSIPNPSESQKVNGGISFGVPGVYHNVKKIDAKSLYPSIILQYKIKPVTKDPFSYFTKMVEYFTEKRFEQKQLFNNTGDKYYDDLQSASKIFINSSYGTLGTEGLNFNDFQMADKITGIGRQVIRTCLKWANNKDINYFLPDYDFNKDILYNDILPKSEVIENLKIIGGDTDSVFFCKNDMSFISNEETKMYLTNINKILPPHINMDDDGTYDSFVILKAKNYIMKWNENNEIKYKFKGSSMTDSKKEKALIEMINNIGYSLCEGIKHDNLVKIYNRYIKEACKVSDIQRWVVKKTISKAILNCENDESRKNEQKVYNAIQHLNYQEGDKIYVYDAQDGMIQEYKKGIPVFLKDGSPKMIPNYILKTIDMYNSDYIPEKLMKRVYDTLKIFKTVINFDNFINFNLVKNQHLINDIINN